METGALCSKCKVLTNGDLIPRIGTFESYPNFPGTRDTLSNKAQTFYFADEVHEHVITQLSVLQDIIRNDGILPLLPSSSYSHHRDTRNVLVYTINEIRTSAETNCHLCAVILEAYDRDRRSLGAAMDIGGDNTNTVLLPHLIMDVVWTPGSSVESIFTAGVQHQQVHFLQICRSTSGHTIEILRTVLHLSSVLKEDLLPPIARHHPCVTPHTVDRLKEWLRSCCNGGGAHALCVERRQKLGTADKPLRVLQIDKQDSKIRVHLRCGDIESGSSYVTLSHCWGPAGLKCKLEAKNLHLYSQDIPFDSLPRTFREAVTMTSMLGVRYLWIDALCIVQDEPEEWNKEAPRMAEIYQNSLVTLAATASDNAEGGLFVQDRYLAPCIVPCKWSDNNNEVQFSHTNNMEYATGDYSLSKRRPLESRGWPFQESLLALRTISFAADQVAWNCRSCGYEENRLTMLGGRTWSKDIMMWTWIGIVENYTKRTLKYGCDRLIALAGIAQAFWREEGLRERDYLAGLWMNPKGATEEQLLWYYDSSGDDREEIVRRVEAQGYIAPSWSWASINSKVRFKGTNNYGRYINEHIEFVRAELESLSSSRFGKLESGSMTLRGLTQKVTLRGSRSPQGNTSYVLSIAGLKIPSEHAKDLRVKVHLDPSLHFLAEVKLQGVLLVGSGFLTPRVPTDSVQREVNGLLLLPARQKGTYKRVGLLSIQDYNKNSKKDDALDMIWTQGSPDVPEDGYLAKHDNGIYEIKMV